MKKFTRFCLILGAILCIVGGSAMAAGYAGGALPEVTGRSSSAVQQIASRTGAQTVGQASITLDPKEYTYLDFQLSGEDLAIRPSQDDQIHIRYQDQKHVRYHTRTEAPADGSSGSTFVFSRMELDNRFHLGFTFASEDQIQVSVPQGMGISVSTVSGDVELSSIDLKSLDLTTSSGEIDLSNVTVSGDLLLSSISGDMELESTAVSGGTHLETTSGELDLERCELAAAAFYTVSGDLTGSAKIDGDIILDTTSGDVNLDLRGSAAHRQGSVDTVSGDMDLVGLAPSGSYPIDVSTVSGDVHIQH